MGYFFLFPFLFFFFKNQQGKRSDRERMVSFFFHNSFKKGIPNTTLCSGSLIIVSLQDLRFYIVPNI